MKQVLIMMSAVFTVGILLILTGCDDIERTDKVSERNQIQHHVVDEEKGVDLTMEASYNNDTMTIVLDNQGSQQLKFGTPYDIDKQTNDQWYQTQFIHEKGFNDIDITLKPSKTYTQKAELDMSDGHYRVIKHLSSNSDVDDDITIGDTFTVGD